MFSLRRIVEPTDMPLDLPAAKAQLRVDDTDHDAEVTRIVKAATTWCEEWCRRAFCTQTWRYSLSAFPPFHGNAYRDLFYHWGLYPPTPGQRVIHLPRPQLGTLNSLKYVDVDGVTQTLDPSLYQVDTESYVGRVAEAFGTVWPPTRWNTDDGFGGGLLRAVILEFDAGYGAATAVPAPIAQGIAMLAAHWWINREAVAIGFISDEVKLSLRNALWPYRVEGRRG